MRLESDNLCILGALLVIVVATLAQEINGTTTETSSEWIESKLKSLVQNEISKRLALVDQRNTEKIKEVAREMDDTQTTDLIAYTDHGTNHIIKMIGELSQRMDQNKMTVDELFRQTDQKIGQTNNGLNEIKEMVGALSQRVEGLESNLSTVENRLRTLCIYPWQLGPDGMCVQLIKISKTWHQARDHCQSFGNESDLVTILNEEQDQWIDEMIPYTSNAWIGANDLDVEGRFKWSSNRNAISYAAWGSGQPNGGTNENCVGIGWLDNKKWHDAPCTDNQYFFCQIQNSL